MSNRGEMNIVLQPRQQMRLDMQPSSHASRVGDYNELLNKPSVNDVELIGNKTSENLKIIISKAAEDWDSYADVVSYKDTAYVYVGPVTKIKYGDGVTTIGNLPFVSAEDARISNEDIAAWNAKADISDIPTTLAELSDDATHRLVTDDEKARWDSTVGNIQSDWNEADPSAGSYIKNKPDIPDDLADLNADSTHRLVTDTEKSTWNNKSDFSGSYTDLTNKPDIPANLSDLQDDASHRLTTDTEKATWNAKSDFSGNYNDLTNKPDIPNDLADLNEDSTHRVVTDTEKATWNAKSDFSGSYNDLTNKPKLADLTDDASHRTVSDSEKLSWDRKSDFSGSYDDLTDKPDIPDELTDLGDVSVTNIQDGQILKYNATTQKFENANESGGTVQDAYKKIKVASTEITASGEDTIEFVAGTNVTLVPDAVNKKVTINSTGGGGGGSTGDMLKEIYDTNNDGIVNAADEATTLTGMTASVSELNALEGVTSNVQSQLDDKADASDIPTALSDLSDDSTHRVVTDAEKSAWNAKSDFSGSYNDLTDKPTIPDDLADLNEDSTHRLVTDAEKTAWDAKSDFSGSYNDLTNKPSIPDDLADLSDDSTHRLVTDVEKAAWDAKSDFSGSYNDLTNKPTIPDDLADLNEDSTHRLVTDSEKATWNGKSDFSGSYNDLTDKPSIPAAQVQSDWNQASSAAVDYIKNKPSIPTDLADLQDDSTHRLVTDTEKSSWDNKSDFSGSYNDLTDKPSIPAPQVQSDWSQADSSAIDYIKNKPSIPSGQVQSDWEQSDSTAVDFIKNKPTIPDELADLQDDASHRTVSDTEKSTWNNKSDFSGDYDDLTNKPTIPSDIDDLGDVAITNIQDGQVLKYNSTTQKFENADESGGAGGHIIENPAGTEMTQRTSLQFVDANVTDDSTNDKTKVENVKVIQSESELTNAPDGIYMGNYDDPTQHVAEANAIDYDNTDSGLDADNVQDAIDEVVDVKADKVTNATENNFAALDANGNLKDSGHKHSDYLTQHQDISGKADKVSSATNGNLAGLNSSGNLTDSGWNGAKDTTSISGNPISISGLKANQLAKNPIITLEPIQDLHGQSKPYPAGGGKNLYSGTNVTISSALYSAVTLDKPIPAGTYTVSAKLSSELTTGAGVSFRKADNSAINRVDISYVAGGRGYGTLTISEDAYKLYFYYSNTTSGTGTRTWSDVQIESGSQATSYAPYENICPISGYDKIEVLSCGKNIFDISKVLVGTVSGNAWTLTVIAGNPTVYDAKFKENTQYTFTGYEQQSATSKNVRLTVWYTDGTAVNVFSDNDTTKQAFSFTSASGKSISRISFSYGTMVGTPSVTITDLQIEEGSSATTYEAPNKTTDLSESLGQTVYGGSDEVRTGKLTNSWYDLDLGSLTWSYWQNNCFYAEEAALNNYAYKNNLRAVCEVYDYTGTTTGISTLSGSAEVKLYVAATNRHIIYVRDTRFTDATQLKTALNGVKIVYELQNPTTIQLTPHEISLLKDYAYVSTNGTNITLDYHNGELASLADVSQLGETVNELGDYIGANKRGTPVDLSPYNTASIKFEVPYDGYVNLNSNSSTTGYVRVVATDINGDNLAFAYMNVTGTYQIQSLFVKKGMFVWCPANTATNATIGYIPLVQ